MKRFDYLSCLMIGIVLILGFTSCGGDDESDNENGGTTSSKRIAKVIDEESGYINEISFTYDSEGRVVRVVQNGNDSKFGPIVSELTYQYSDTHIESYKHGQYSSRSHTYTLSNGLIVKDVEENLRSGDIITSTYTYDDNGYMTSLTYRESGGYTEKLNCVWKEGNLMSLADHEYSYSNILWSNRLFFYFDGSGIDQYLWSAGYFGKIPKYLPLTDSFNDVSYEYTLCDGLVSEIRMIERGKVTYRRSYVWE